MTHAEERFHSSDEQVPAALLISCSAAPIGTVIFKMTVVLAMSLLGLIAIWIPAQRALSVDPAILLSEE